MVIWCSCNPCLGAVQMTGGGASVVLGPSDPDTWHPDLDWLERELNGPRPPKLVYVVSPGNPTGTLPSTSSATQPET